MLDPEIWKIVFEVYARHPTSAFSLAFQLIAVKQSLQQGHKGMREAMEAFDLALESLIPTLSSIKWAISCSAPLK